MEIEFIKTFGVCFFFVGIIFVFLFQTFVEHYNNKKLVQLLQMQTDILMKALENSTNGKTLVLIKDKESGIVELKAISTSPREAEKVAEKS